MSEQDAIERIRQRLSARFDIESIVLFGSRARGDAKEESDFDVLVVANSDVPFIERQGLAMLQLGRKGFAVDLLVYTPEEAERASAITGSAIYWARREGRVMYAK